MEVLPSEISLTDLNNIAVRKHRTCVLPSQSLKTLQDHMHRLPDELYRRYCMSNCKLSVPERITYKLCILVYNCLHGTAPRYLQDVIQHVAEVTSRRRLRSASSSALVLPATRRSSLGDRAFAVAGPRAWNSLQEFVSK